MFHWYSNISGKRGNFRKICKSKRSKCKTLSKFDKNSETNCFGFLVSKCFILLTSVLYFSSHFTGLILDIIKICMSILSSKIVFLIGMEYECIETWPYWSHLPKLFLLNVFSLGNVTVSDQSKTQAVKTEQFMNFFPDMGERVFRGAEHSCLLQKWSTGATKEEFALVQYRCMRCIRDQIQS